MKRALGCDSGDHLTFFRLYDGCLMDTAALSWCKFFGSPSENLNWKNLFPETAILVRPRLEQRLRAAVNDLDDLSGQLKLYRDTYLAHHDLNQAKRAKRHPDLEPLRSTAWILYDEIFLALQQVSQVDGLPCPKGIDGSKRENIEGHWRMIASKAREATNSCDDFP